MLLNREYLQSKEESSDFEGQINVLIDKLSKLSAKEIIGFEFTFRKILSKSCNYNVLSAAQIILWNVSDDSFLYLRCRLIVEGKKLYYEIIKNPDYIANVLEVEYGGEEMLSVADKAFIAINYFNYNEGVGVTGIKQTEEELPKKYPRLWKRFRE